MINTMKDLLCEQVQDLYDAENRILAALPKMEAAAHHDELKAAFHEHTQETKDQVNRLAEACSILGISPEGETCEATKGLIEEGEEMIRKLSDPLVGDAGLIAAAQRIEHYEIASYGSAATFAKCIDEDRVCDLLGATLAEEKEADSKLLKIATGSIFSSGINKEAVRS